MAPSRARIAVAAAVAAAMALASTASANDRIRDLRRQRDTDRAAAAAAVRETNLLQAEDAELAEALANISESIDAQQVRVGRAHQELAAAEQELLERLAVLDATEAERGWLQEELARMAVESYVGVGTNLQEPWLDSDDLNETAIRLTLLDAAAGRDRDVLDRLRTLEAERQSQAAEAARLRDEASGLRQAVEEELAELEQWHRLRQDLKAEVQVRIDEWERAAAQRSQDALDMTALIRRTQVELLGLDLGDPAAASVQGFIAPIDAEIGSRFGMRRHPIFRVRRMHNGVDYGAPTGTPIWASKTGTVIFAGWKGGYGNTVVIHHAGGVSTLYAHMSKLMVEDGSYVTQGEVIGLVGSTGWSTGPHLHFEVRRNGDPADPELFLPV